MLPFLTQARFGSYLIFPFQFQEGEFHAEWADRTFVAKDVTTVDINEIAKSMLSQSGPDSIGRCWSIPREVLLHEIADIEPGKASTPQAETENNPIRLTLTDSWLYVFHSHIIRNTLIKCR